MKYGVVALRVLAEICGWLAGIIALAGGAFLFFAAASGGFVNFVFVTVAIMIAGIGSFISALITHRNPPRGGFWLLFSAGGLLVIAILGIVVILVGESSLNIVRRETILSLLAIVSLPIGLLFLGSKLARRAHLTE